MISGKPKLRIYIIHEVVNVRVQVQSGYNGDSGSAGVYIPFIYIYLGRTLPYPVHGTTSYKSGLVLLGEHKFYYISTFLTLF